MFIFSCIIIDSIQNDKLCLNTQSESVVKVFRDFGRWCKINMHIWYICVRYHINCKDQLEQCHQYNNIMNDISKITSLHKRWELLNYHTETVLLRKVIVTAILDNQMTITTILDNNNDRSIFFWFGLGISLIISGWGGFSKWYPGQ